MYIEVASEEVARQAQPQLVNLIIRTVDDGASIGWLPPMPSAEAEAYWAGRIAAVHNDETILLLAWDAETLIGTAQLRLEQRPNGIHRAEVQKVMVHPNHRQRGIGKALMLTLEEQARHHHRSMLFLDTREGDASEGLYQKMGYARVGAIPNYVLNPDGDFAATVVYAKILA